MSDNAGLVAKGHYDNDTRITSVRLVLGTAEAELNFLNTEDGAIDMATLVENFDMAVTTVLRAMAAQADQHE